MDDRQKIMEEIRQVTEAAEKMTEWELRVVLAFIRGLLSNKK